MKLNSKQINLIKIILMVSCAFFTLLLSTRFNEIHILIGVFLSFIIGIFIVNRLKFSFINKKYFLISLLLSLVTVKNLVIFCDKNTKLVNMIVYGLTNKMLDNLTVNNFIGILAVPFTIFIIYTFLIKIYPLIIKFFKNLNKVEKMYLIITFVFAAIFTLLVTNFTTAFTLPTYNNTTAFDVIYNSDTSKLVKEKVYYNVSLNENDIRQPLFGLFALPFGITAQIVSELCFFLPKDTSFGIVMTIIQFMLTGISIVLISRMMKIKKTNQKYFFLLMATNFTYLIFSLLLEQYVIALFYLVLAVYYHFNNPNKTNYFYVGAAGTLSTSAIIIPFIRKVNKKNIQKLIIPALECFVLFICIMIVSGQFPQFLTVSERIEFLSRFSGKIPFMERIYQYTHFISGTIIPNTGKIMIYENHPAYHSLPYTNISFSGIIILVLCYISFILNKKNKFLNFAFYWIIFSMVILFIVGWGLQENGLVLYNYYFAWAFIVLLYNLIKKMFNDDKKSNKLVLFTSIVLLIPSIYEISKILSFAVKYYGI